MSTRHAWLLAALVAMLTGCTADEPLPAVRADQPVTVSLLQLIVMPERFDGQLVRVKGFCRFEFEGSALYLHEEDHRASINENAVWLDVGWPVPEKLRPLSDEYVLVEAIFSASDKGHLGSFQGSLQEISRLELWPSAKEYERARRLTFELRGEQ